MLPPKSSWSASKYSTMMMVLVLSAATRAAFASATVCDCCLCFSGNCYTATLLNTEFINTLVADFDRNANTLYFTDDYRSIKMMDLDSMSITTLINHRVSLLAVDRITGELYFSAFGGIYKYVPLEDEPLTIPITEDVDFDNMWVHNATIYLSVSGKLRVVNGSAIQKIPALDSVYHYPEYFIVDNTGNMYVSDVRRVYRIKAGEDKATIIIEEGGKFALDKLGGVYLYSGPVIFHFDPVSDKFVMIGVFKLSMSYILFDKHDHIVTKDMIFYRHRMSSNKCSINKDYADIVRLPVDTRHENSSSSSVGS